MTRYLVTIHGPKSRYEAQQIIAKAPAGTRVEIKAAKRSGDQNSLMWVLLSKLAVSLPWDGRLRTPERWKDLFMDGLRSALDDEQETLSALDGSGRQVNVGNSTSDLSVEEMTILIELILRFGAEHGVQFNDEARAA